MLVQLPNGWEFVSAHAGLPARRNRPGHGAARAPRARTALPGRAREVTAIAVPDRIGDFDHQALAREVAEATPAYGCCSSPASTVGTERDLRALAVPADDPAAARARSTPDPRQRRRRRVPALRRHDRAAQADRPHPRRLRLQRAAQRRGLRLRRRHRLPRPRCPPRTTSRWPARASSAPCMNGGRVVLARTPDPDKALPAHRPGGRHGHRAWCRPSPSAGSTR